MSDVSGHRRLIEDFLRAIESGDRPICDGVEGRRSVELIEATPWLKPLMPGNGFHLGPKLSDEQKADVEFGFRIAKETSRLEIGQTVLVKGGTVLAVEAFEGTDECLARGGELAGEKAAAPEQQNPFRFPRPCLRRQRFEIGRRDARSAHMENGRTALLAAMAPGNHDKGVGAAGQRISET